MLTNANTITDASIRKDASTKLVTFFAFVKMDGLVNFAIKVSSNKDFKFFGRFFLKFKFLDIELIYLFRHKRV